MKFIIIILALCLCAFGRQPSDTGLHHLDPVYATGTCGDAKTGPHEYVFRWPSIARAWYGQLQFRSGDNAQWFDNHDLQLGNLCTWQYDSCRVRVYDRYNIINTSWQYRIILW